MTARRAGSPAAYAALAAVCVFWGTTYLAIRIAIETLPPAFVVCTRYILSGSILLAIALRRGAQLPRGRELWVACACGALILGIGNGSLVYAEVLVPSGLASLFVTLAPFWMVGLEVLTGGERLRARSVVGMLIGFLGTVLLLLPGTEKGAVSRSTLVGFAILQIGVLGWTIGSLYQRRQPARAHPIVTEACSNWRRDYFLSRLFCSFPRLRRCSASAAFSPFCIWSSSVRSSATAPTSLLWTGCRSRWRLSTPISIQSWPCFWAGCFSANRSVGGNWPRWRSFSRASPWSKRRPPIHAQT